MEIGLEKIKKIFAGKGAAFSGSDFIYRRLGSLIMLFTLAMFVYSIYIWYSVIYAPGWESSRKEEYVRNKEKSVNFNQGGFGGVVKEYDERKSEFEKMPTGWEDIFRVKK